MLALSPPSLSLSALSFCVCVCVVLEDPNLPMVQTRLASIYSDLLASASSTGMVGSLAPLLFASLALCSQPGSLLLDALASQTIGLQVFSLTWPSPWATQFRKDLLSLFLRRVTGLGRRACLWQITIQPTAQGRTGHGPQNFGETPKWATHLVRGERVKIDTLHKEGNKSKHTDVTASCVHRPFSYNLGFTYLRDLLSPKVQSLREKWVWLGLLCPLAVDLTPLGLSSKFTELQDNMSVWWGRASPPNADKATGKQRRQN